MNSNHEYTHYGGEKVKVYYTEDGIVFNVRQVYIPFKELKKAFENEIMDITRINSVLFKKSDTTVTIGCLTDDINKFKKILKQYGKYSQSCRKENLFII